MAPSNVMPALFSGYRADSVANGLRCFRLAGLIECRGPLGLGSRRRGKLSRRQPHENLSIYRQLI